MIVRHAPSGAPQRQRARAWRGLGWRRAALVCAVVGLSACGSPRQGDAPSLNVTVAAAMAPLAEQPPTLTPLGHLTIDRDEHSALTRHFGGISGLDYDARADRWVMLSDDRSERAPARFYSAQLRWDERGLVDARVTGVTTLLQRDGSPYPGAQTPVPAGTVAEIPDAEAIRLEPGTGRLLWTSEGDRKRALQPFIRWSAPDGSYAGEIQLPPRLEVHRDEPRGSRNNATLEGLAFAADGSVWLAMEQPLIEDGEPPTVHHGALTRITHLDRTGRVLGQYAYPLDAVPVAPTGGQRRCDNGISELLVTPSGTLLVLERSGREVGSGDFAFNIRLYEVSADAASDVSETASLAAAPPALMRKRLVLDLQALGLPHVDNLEGMAWGPRWRDGRPTLVMISDDNFSKAQVTQVLAFAWRDVLSP